MTSVIVQQARRAYLGAMASLLFRLLTLIAVLLMPAGMASAPALAQPAPAAGHCDEHQEPADAPSKPQVHCTGCSALPAIGVPEAAAALRPLAPRLIAQIQPISGREPEIATPPPKLF